MAFHEDEPYHLDHLFELASLHSLNSVLFEPARADIHSKVTRPTMRDFPITRNLDRKQ